MSKIPPKIQSLSAQAKETIYIDVDDEITAVIDKVTSSKAKIIALVLPKRATVMQSIVNMKLLKRTAEEAGKHVVLITSETSLMPLIGLVGMHVAPTPTSKPVVPKTPAATDDEPERVDEPLDIVDGTEVPGNDFDPSTAASTPVGVLAANEPESILMTDDPEEISDDETAGKALLADGKPDKPDKKLKVPNFNKFKVGIILGVLALILIVTGWVFAAVILPKASVAITTDSTTITSDLNLTLDANAKTLDADNKIIPAAAQSVSKSYSQDAAATGQQNNGTKATGAITMNAGTCSATVPGDISAGSTVTSGTNIYVLNSGVSFVPVVSKLKCTFQGQDSKGSSSIAITALKPGTAYNVSDATFGVGSGISSTGSTSGGTDNIVKVLAQADIDGAKDKISSQDTTAVQTELAAALKAKGLMPVSSTLIAGDQQVTASAKAGDTVDSVKVTATVPYTMLGIKQDDLKELVIANVEAQIDDKKQKIIDDGVAKAKFSQQNPGSATSAVVAAKVRSTAGPELDATKLKEQIAGLKAGDIKELLQDSPGIVDVQVAYSPFWVNTAPKDAKKLTIMIDGVTR